jgi:hypothetical protein
MKNNSETKLKVNPNFQGFEILNYTELHLVRGGNSEGQTKTKETDVYDTRET